MSKTPPLGMTQDNFSAVINGTKTETRRLSNGSDKPRYNVGDRCYLTEPTQIFDHLINDLCVWVAYEWNKPDKIHHQITEDDKTKIESRKTGIKSRQIARFMLKSFARYWVEITDVRIERLLDITAEAAIAEGIKYIKRPELACPVYLDYIRNEYIFADPKDSYISEIEMLHGKAIAGSNPWLWVYKFKLVHA